MKTQRKSSKKGKDIAASWAMKLAMTAVVIGSSVGVNVDKAFADSDIGGKNVVIEDPEWRGMPTSAKTNVINRLESVQHKIEVAPEAVQIKVENKLESIQQKVESR